MKTASFIYVICLLVAITWFFTYFLTRMSYDVDTLRARVEGNVHNEWVTKEIDL